MNQYPGFDRRRFIGTAAFTVAAAGLGFVDFAKAASFKKLTGTAPINKKLASLKRATGWLNSKPINESDLAGKVVLVNFCTYSCINWLRTLPYVRAWASKYKEQGLVLIGVHTPEFTFEENIENVHRAIQRSGIHYPLAIDNDRAIWNAFDNQYWPALYLVDASGKMRHHQFGEGGYEAMERAIQQCLSEAGKLNVSHELVAPEGQGEEMEADWDNLRSPENYLGYGRTENFVSPKGVVRDRLYNYTAPAQPGLNQWALAGNWTMGKEAILVEKANGYIRYRFHGRDLNLVMGLPSQGTAARFRVRIDGRPPGAAHGADIDEQGNGLASDQRLYQLVRQPKPIIDRLFEIEFLDAGVEAFSFTFG